MPSTYVRESITWYNGYKYVVVFGDGGHRCGYVAVGPDHPLFGIDYSQDIKSPELLQELQSSPIGKRGIVDLFCWDGESISPNMLIDVHGGLTYSSIGTNTQYPTDQHDPAWWFGFDCGHYGDATDLLALEKYFPERYAMLSEFSLLHYDGNVCSLAYVELECERLIDQLICISDVLKQTRVLIA